MASGRSRRWMCTLYAESVVYEQCSVKYIKYQQEECPTTKKKHWQIYVVLSNPMGLTGIKKVFSSNTLHADICNGDHESCVNYVSKLETSIPNTQHEFGAYSQGKRVDLLNAIQCIEDGGKMVDLLENHAVVYVKYHNAFDKLLNRYSRDRDSSEAPKIIVYFGPPGCGKTRRVYDAHNIDDIYSKRTDNKWWDGYEGQPIILIDDYRGEFSYTEFLKLTDRYRYYGEVKGGHTKISAHTIYITSNRHPKDWYQHIIEERDWSKVTPLNRRITSIVEME